MGLARAPLAALLALASAHPAMAQATISDGRLVAEVGEEGLFVGFPAGDLRTYDGPEVVLAAGTEEWFGIRYSTPAGRVSAVGSGSARDWAGREPVQRVSFSASASEATAVTRAGDLLIETRFRFDDDGPYLLVAVDLTNVGTGEITDLFYTREWSGGGESWSFPSDFDGLRPLAPGIRRSVWMLNDLSPGETEGVGMSFVRHLPPATPLLGVDVPLSLWTHPAWPSGLTMGSTNGISFYDYDRDGFIDMFSCESGELWRNVGGANWVLAANLDPLLPFTVRRYGSSFGDYDNDGLADIGTEPREGFGGDDCFHLLRNLGGGPNFVDVATDPAIVDVQPCMADSETICWGDVDGDGNLDMFLPVYDIGLSPGNFFLYNLGPTGPAGAYRFREESGPAGLDLPPVNNRPEGAQLCDVDFDGDVDLYSNGTVYQNHSVPGTASFDMANSAATGIGFSGNLDEGCAFWDHDMDGDYDFVIAFTSGTIGVRVYENLGDGNFAPLPVSTVASHTTGLNLGLSYEDWDNDGDIDFTTRQVFRRNMLMETGTASYSVATTGIPSSHLTSATPAWGDWDLDGDLDCALGNWLSIGHFYENTTYDAATPDDQRRYVRVRVMRDSTAVAGGLETEFGASVEIAVAGEEDGPRRVKFVSSAGGYLNQSEYVLHFALPDDPFPGDPAADLTFDVRVDFVRGAAPDHVRVDRHVNPALGAVSLARLADREITVYRSGRVELDGCALDPTPARSPLLTTTTGGLVLPNAVATLPVPVSAPSALRFVGIELDTVLAGGPLRLEEIVLDGQLDDPSACAGGPSNVFVWDVTGTPVLVGALAADTSPRNNRSYLRANVRLDPGRTYRVVAAVTELRATAVSAPLVDGVLTTHGGLDYADGVPCSGAIMALAPVDPGAVYLALRVSEDAGEPFVSLGNGLAGAPGVPQLAGTGAARPGTPYTLSLSNALPGTNALLTIGFAADCLDVVGGTLVPSREITLFGLPTGPAGTLAFTGTFPPLPVGSSVYLQAAVVDPAAPAGLALSNALAVTAQP